MKFLHGMEPVGCLFTKTSWRRDREGTKDAGLKFEMTLTPDVMKLLPRVLQDGIGVMQRDATATLFEVDLEVNKKTVAFHAAPGAKRDLLIHDVTLSNLYLEKLKKGTGADIILHFGLSLPLTHTTAIWLVNNFGNTVFVQFSDTQGSLTSDEPADGEQEEVTKFRKEA